LEVWGGDAQRSGRRGDERKGKGEVVTGWTNLPPKKRTPKSNCTMPPSDLKIRSRGMFVMTTVTKVSIFGSLSFAK
jgi:hypothetical protein